MSKVRIGLVGLGFMGSTHFRIYQNLKDAEVVALAEIDPKRRAGDVSTVWGNIGSADNSVPLDMTGVKGYESAFDMIADDSLKLDVVDVCVPTPFHADIITAALKKDLNVFSEKPLCRDLEQMRQIEAAVKASKGFFNVGLCVRAWPEYFDARERFHAGEFGKMLSAEFRRLSQSVQGCGWQNWYNTAMCGGALLDLHTHDTDVVRSFFGRPKRVSSFGLRGICSPANVDLVTSRFDYGDNSLVIVTGGWCAAKTVPFEMSFQLICEKATVRLMSEGYKIYWNDGRIETPTVDTAAGPTGWHQELAYFVDCVKNHVKPERYQTLDSVLDSFKIVMAEQESIDTDRTVTVQY